MAQPSGPSGNAEPKGWRLGVGAGSRFAPSYVGDDAYRMSLLPSIQVKYGDRFFASIENGVGYNIVNSDGFRTGPIARIRFGRDENGSQPFAIAGDATTDLIGLGDVGATAELGGFFEYKINSLKVGLEARKGANGHKGAVIDASLRYGGRSFVFGPPLIYSFGPRVTVVDNNYHSTYFDVDASQSIASGLPIFDANGGIHSYGFGATFILPITRDDKLSAVIAAGYDRLAGDAAISPLVQQRGSRDQISTGLFFSYWF
ncbi:MAG: MipA/OmpV family protein [Marinicaulis sp.]|nr:MipA/OmpV family protein [Marinicaulis sp.]